MTHDLTTADGLQAALLELRILAGSLTPDMASSLHIRALIAVGEREQKLREALKDMVDVFGPGVDCFGDGAGVGEIDAVRKAREALGEDV